MYNKKCGICGIEFTTKHKRSKYCSHKCSGIRNNKKTITDGLKEKKCVGCGIIFKTTLKFKTYCFKGCRYNSRKSVFSNHELREYILERDNYTCQKCKIQIGDASFFHIHHKIPMYQGGKHTEENIITLCKSCHLIEHKLF